MNDLTPEQLAEFRRRWDKVSHDWQVTLLDPLPRKTRIRLAVQRAIDRTGSWLCWHHVEPVATILWKVTGGLK